jgi:hypothetical protein
VATSTADATTTISARAGKAVPASVVVGSDRARARVASPRIPHQVSTTTSRPVRGAAGTSVERRIIGHATIIHNPRTANTTPIRTAAWPSITASPAPASRTTVRSCSPIRPNAIPVTSSSTTSQKER